MQPDWHPIKYNLTMPEFVDVASHFDDIQALDAYTAAPLFLSQFNTFDETSMDGSVNKRKSMSVRPGTVMPTRRAIQALAESWLVGTDNTDGFQGVAVRTVYLLKKVTHLATIRTPREQLTGAPGTQVYVNRDFRKETVNGVSNSEYQPFWDIFTAPNESASRGAIISIGGVLHRVRTSYVDLNGLRLAAADQLEPWVNVSATYPTGVYNKVTQQWDGGPTTVPGLLLDSYMLYDLDSQADPKPNSGDKSLVTELPIAIGKKITINGATWTVLTAQPELDAYKHHIRLN